MIRWSCQRAARMGAGRAELEPDLARQGLELRTALGDLRRRLAEVGALAGAHLDLRRDQLADEMRLDVGPDRGRLHLLEAIREPERLGIEQRELLLDGESEVGALLERRTGARELLLRERRCSSPMAAKGYATGASKRAATPAHDQRSTTVRRAALAERLAIGRAEPSSSASFERSSPTFPFSNAAR